MRENCTSGSLRGAPGNPARLPQEATIVNFKEACELAKKYPGSAVRRTDSGSFMVLDAGGCTLEPSEHSDSPLVRSESGDLQNASIQEVQAQLEDALSELQYFRVAYERATQEVNFQLSQNYSHIKNLRDQENKYMTLHKQYNELKEKYKLCSEERSHLKAKIDSISNIEWKQINSRLDKEKKEYADEMRAKRVIIHCSCAGEVENCVRCYGSGEYTVDGYGNRV